MIKQYEIIVADPPWKYNFCRSKSRQIENQYNTMTQDELFRFVDGMPIAKNSILYLWGTSPKLNLAFKTMEEWGFDYLSSFVWDKKRIGMGYWNRGRHEHVLIGRRGKFSPPATEFRIPSVIERKRSSTHSRKPEELQDHIDLAFPNRTKMELFARRQRPGWDCFGDNPNVKPYGVITKMIRNALVVKHCPCCKHQGSSLQQRLGSPDRGEQFVVTVFCEICGIRASRTVDVNSYKSEEMNVKISEAVDTAVAAWNKRFYESE